MSARLDFTDDAAVRAWVADLRVACDDAAGVTEDMLPRGRSRSLGHVEHRRLYREAKAKLAQLLDFADPPGGTEPDGKQGDPAGNGGSPAL